LKEFGECERPDGGARTARTEGLTARQLQVLTMVAEGLTYKEVGMRLHLSERTVKYHMGEIVERLHLENRAQAVAHAQRTGMVK
jgi:two-component system NarL family response regulator